MRDLEALSICFIAGTLGQGGAERQLFYMVRALRSAGAKVRVLSLTRDEFWESPIRELGVAVEWIGSRPSKVARVAAAIAAVRAHGADVVQSQHFFTNLYAVVAARASGAREVGAIRSNATWEVASSGVLGRPGLRAPRVLAANSLAGLRNATSMGVRSDRLVFLPNVVDTDRFAPASVGPDRPIQVLGVGRRGAEKRFDRFLDIVAAVRRRAGRQVTALLVTTGRPNGLEAHAERLGLGPGVLEFRSDVSDMPSVYQSADVLMLTSDWEGTPNVVLEAMASGLPVVSTSVGGVPDIVEHGVTGRLAAAGDDRSLEEALIDLSDDDRERRAMGARARAHVVARHSVESLPGHLTNLYTKVLS
jgi:glycosyltransferase involved in cell wall biosynthesis